MKRLLVLVAICGWGTFAHADPPRNIQETIDYVRSLQTKSGGFLLQQSKDGEKPGAPTLRATSAGIRALKYFGGKVPNKDAAAKFVASCHNKETGGFANTSGGKPDVFSTAVGLMAVVELDMPKEDYAKGGVKYLSDNAKTFEDIRIAVAGLEAIKAKSPEAESWWQVIRKMENPDGTFGKGEAMARDTGGAVVAILRLGMVFPKTPIQVIAILKKGQHLNGAWGKGPDATSSDLESSYRVMRAFVMLKALPDDVEGIRTFVEKCRNKDGGYSLAPGGESNVSACYFAAIIHHWLKDKK
jgi:prenyltransferase beta subunit